MSLSMKDQFCTDDCNVEVLKKGLHRFQVCAPLIGFAVFRILKVLELT